MLLLRLTSAHSVSEGVRRLAHPFMLIGKERPWLQR